MEAFSAGHLLYSARPASEPRPLLTRFLGSMGTAMGYVHWCFNHHCGDLRSGAKYFAGHVYGREIHPRVWCCHVCYSWAKLRFVYSSSYLVARELEAHRSAVAEMAHPAWRGTLTGLYNTFWFVGGIPATWTLYGTEHIDSDLSWRLPIWLQAVASGFVLLGCLFCPETPRWVKKHPLYKVLWQETDDRHDSWCPTTATRRLFE